MRSRTPLPSFVPFVTFLLPLSPQSGDADILFGELGESALSSIQVLLSRTGNAWGIPFTLSKAVTLEDKFTRVEGRVYLTGTQALIRLMLEQRARDEAQGLNTAGFVFMDTPGYDPVSATGQVAGGANLICFTTGRGSAYGCAPAPSLKLSTNNALYQRQKDDIDINCGEIIEGRIGIDEGAVAVGVEQRVDLGGVGHLDHEDPAAAVGLGVDQFGAVAEGLVDLHHGAAHR